MNRKKGEIGYIRGQKLKRFLTTLLLFFIPLVIFISGLLYHGSTQNILTVVAVVGCLPACKSTVGLIMMLLQKPKKKGYFDGIEEHAKDLVMAYEMVFTTYEKNVMVDAAAVCGYSIVCLADGEPRDRADFIQEHIQKMVRHNGFQQNVYVLTNYDKFTERLDSLNQNRGSLEKDLDPERDGQVRHVMLNLVL